MILSNIPKKFQQESSMHLVYCRSAQLYRVSHKVDCQTRKELVRQFPVKYNFTEKNYNKMCPKITGNNE